MVGYLSITTGCDLPCPWRQIDAAEHGKTPRRASRALPAPAGKSTASNLPVPYMNPRPLDPGPCEPVNQPGIRKMLISPEHERGRSHLAGQRRRSGTCLRRQPPVAGIKPCPGATARSVVLG